MGRCTGEYSAWLNTTDNKVEFTITTGDFKVHLKFETAEEVEGFLNIASHLRTCAQGLAKKEK